MIELRDGVVNSESTNAISATVRKLRARKRLTRGDLAAILILLFVAILALAEKCRPGIERIINTMTMSAIEERTTDNLLSDCLAEALAQDPAKDLTKDLFHSPAVVMLRGNTVWIDNTSGGFRVTFAAEDLFLSASATLHQDGRRLIETFAALTRPYPNLMEVVGYVAEEETRAASYELSWQRVKAVADYLEKRRIDPSRLVPVAAGGSASSGHEALPASRVEIIVEVPREQD